MDGYLIALILILCLAIIYIVIYTSNMGHKTKFKDKLFNSLMNDSNTVYIMIDSITNEVVYLSYNFEDILGIKRKNRSDSAVVKEIFNLGKVSEEIRRWNKKEEYVSQMIEYDNPMYNHTMWIRIKIYSFKSKKKEYFVIQILDATKEHDHQHILVTQASDIKSRESQLDQITASSYDVELNVNLNSDSYILKYFKPDNLYFGEEKKGVYSEAIKYIASTYINKNDVNNFINMLSFDTLKNHLNKYELNSYKVRYRLGNQLKNNVWLESTVFFLNSRQGSRVSILTKNVTEDAESIRKQNVLLQNALNDAKMASKAKTDLISTISLNVRTPLSSIIGLSESVLKEKLDENVKENIKSIYDSSNEVLEIVDELLDPSKVEKKLIEKEEKEYKVSKLFNRVLNNARQYLNGKNIDINLNLNSNLPLVLYGDSRRISEAVTSIVNNSIKYTDEGNILISVKGEKINSKVNLIIEITDTGSGIDEQKLNSIIESKDSNTGIGSVKNLMKVLDGKFEIESKVGEYTKVILSFEQKIVEDNKVRELMNSNKFAEEFDLTGKEILVVDDNRLNLKVTKKMLEPYNLNVSLVESGEECIEIIKDKKFDLILLDQMMPGLSGVEVLNKLKEDSSFNTPVVVLTADAIVGQKEKYLNSGFDDYISKPIDKKELSRVLKKFLRN